jgi:hypothetical protein
VIEKKRPTIPKNNNNCYKFLTSIIKDCWIHDQEKRPSFNQILEKLINNQNSLNFDYNIINKTDNELIDIEKLIENNNENLFKKSYNNKNYKNISLNEDFSEKLIEIDE